MFPLSQKTIQYKNQEFTLLYDEVSIQKQVKKIADQINRFYKDLLINDKDQQVYTICVLNGALYFYTDLIKNLHFMARPQFFLGPLLWTDSKNQQKVQINQVQNKHVLIVLNIADSNEKIHSIAKKMNDSGAKTVNFAALISKSTEEIKATCKWTCFKSPNYIEMIGYGFDKQQRFRQLSQIYKKT